MFINSWSPISVSTENTGPGDIVFGAGSEGARFLRRDGTWALPSNTAPHRAASLRWGPVTSVPSDFEGTVDWGHVTIDYSRYPNEPRQLFGRSAEFDGWLTGQVTRILSSAIVTTTNPIRLEDPSITQFDFRRGLDLMLFPNPASSTLSIRTESDALLLAVTALTRGELRQQTFREARNILEHQIYEAYDRWDPGSPRFDGRPGRTINLGRNSSPRDLYLTDRYSIRDEMMNSIINPIREEEDMRFLSEMMLQPVTSLTSGTTSTSTSSANILDSIAYMKDAMYAYSTGDGKYWATLDPKKAGMVKKNPPREPPQQLDLFDNM